RTRTRPRLMFPPVFTIAAASSAVTSLIGSAPVRLWPFAQADTNPQTPYAVWQVIYGNPENYLAGVPDIDGFGVQGDAYATTATESRNVARALRDAFEADNAAYISGYNGEFIDEPTGLYRTSFTVEFLTARTT